MTTDSMAPRKAIAVSAASLVCIGLVAAASVAMYGQEQSAIYLFAVDRKGVPVLDLEPSDIAIKEDVGPSNIVSVRRFGWPLKVTVLVDNGPRTGDALVHYRTGLKKFFAGLPPDVPVSLIATAPNPRWLIRETKDRVQIEKGVNLITIDDRVAGSLQRRAHRIRRASRRRVPERVGRAVAAVPAGPRLDRHDGSGRKPCPA